MEGWVVVVGFRGVESERDFGFEGRANGGTDVIEFKCGGLEEGWNR